MNEKKYQLDEESMFQECGESLCNRMMDWGTSEVLLKLKERCLANDLSILSVIRMLMKRLEDSLLCSIKNHMIEIAIEDRYYSPHESIDTSDVKSSFKQLSGDSAAFKIGNYGTVCADDMDLLTKYLSVLAYVVFYCRSERMFIEKLESVLTKNLYVSRSRLLRWKPILAQDSGRYIASFIRKHCTKTSYKYLGIKKLSIDDQARIVRSFNKEFPPKGPLHHLGISFQIPPPPSDLTTKIISHDVIKVSIYSYHEKERRKCLSICVQGNAAIIINALFHRYLSKDDNPISLDGDVKSLLDKYGRHDPQEDADDCFPFVTKVKKELAKVGIKLETVGTRAWRIPAINRRILNVDFIPEQFFLHNIFNDPDNRDVPPYKKISSL